MNFKTPSLADIRAKSPIKKIRNDDDSPLLDEDNPAFIRAFATLYNAAWKFDRGKNGDLLRTLDNRELDKVNFRTILK